MQPKRRLKEKSDVPELGLEEYHSLKSKIETVNLDSPWLRVNVEPEPDHPSQKGKVEPDRPTLRRTVEPDRSSLQEMVTVYEV